VMIEMRFQENEMYAVTKPPSNLSHLGIAIYLRRGRGVRCSARACVRGTQAKSR